MNLFAEIISAFITGLAVVLLCMAVLINPDYEPTCEPEWLIK